MSELPLQIAGTVIWLGLAGLTVLGVRRYAKTRRTDAGLWQFTIRQLAVLLTVSTVMIWMYYCWAVDYFTP
jgi:hypothetical protein